MDMDAPTLFKYTLQNGSLQLGIDLASLPGTSVATALPTLDLLVPEDAEFSPIYAMIKMPPNATYVWDQEHLSNKLVATATLALIATIFAESRVLFMPAGTCAIAEVGQQLIHIRCSHTGEAALA